MGSTSTGKVKKSDITLTVTHDDYANLIKLAYAGNWLINSVRLPGEEISEFARIEQIIFQIGITHGFTDLLDDKSDRDLIYPSKKLEESEVESYINDYNEENMWEELIDVLAARDFSRLYSESEQLAMTEDEHRDKFFDLIDKYGKEFEEHDADRLEIVTDETQR